MPTVQVQAALGRRRRQRHVCCRDHRVCSCCGRFLGGMVRALSDDLPCTRGPRQASGGAPQGRAVDVDANPGLAGRFGAQSIPLLVVIRDGQEIDRVVGALPRAALEQRLRPVLAA
jgi:hypothetical protein